MRNVTIRDQRRHRLSRLCGFGFLFGTLEVQGEEPLQKLFVAQISGPAVGGGDGGVEFLVGEVQPGGAFVVEVRERALFQLGGSIGIARLKARIAHRADAGYRVHGSRLQRKFMILRGGLRSGARVDFAGHRPQDFLPSVP